MLSVARAHLYLSAWHGQKDRVNEEPKHTHSHPAPRAPPGSCPLLSPHGPCSSACALGVLVFLLPLLLVTPQRHAAQMASACCSPLAQDQGLTDAPPAFLSPVSPGSWGLWYQISLSIPFICQTVSVCRASISQMGPSSKKFAIRCEEPAGPRTQHQRGEK